MHTDSPSAAPRPHRGHGLGRRRRAAAWSAWRLLPGLVLGAVAAVVGGVIGVLIGFLAVVILLDRFLDRVLGSAGLQALEAEHVFLRLSHERRRAAIARRVRRRPAGHDDLAYLADDGGWAAIASRRRLGLQSIPIDSIVGTVDRDKAAAFDRDFRPPEFSRGRWMLMYRAARRDVALPPISVYRVGDEHYVRDGHHRVSIARATGADAIDADVVELLPRSA